MLTLWSTGKGEFNNQGFDRKVRKVLSIIVSKKKYKF